MKIPLNTPRNRRIAYELLGLFIILAAFSLVLYHINTTDWKDFVFANSDILTLSLVHQSISLHEPFAWVFSSQIFLFPEGPIYAFASLFSGNFKDVLVINALINVLSAYGLIRMLMKIVSGSKLTNTLFSLFYIVGILFLMATEQQDGGNSIAMYFFVTTAYYGVILSALLALNLILLLLKRKASVRLDKHTAILIAIYALITLLAGTSNPLFYLQFSAPLLLALFITLLSKSITKRLFAWLAASTVVPIIISVLIRKTILSSYFSPLGGVSSYLHFKKILPALHVYIHIATQMLAGSIWQRLEILVFLGGIVFSLALFTYTSVSRLRRSSSSLANITNHYSFIISFATIAPVATIFGAIITGNPLMRYLLPVLFFTPLVLIPFCVYFVRQYRLIAIFGLIILTLTTFALAIVHKPGKTYETLTNYYPPSAACLDESLSGTSYNAGVAQYWRARVLQLNSRDGHIVEQTDGTLKRFGWLYNDASYDLYDLSFVVVDKPELTTNQEVSTDPMFVIPSSTALYALGKPSNIYTCPEFDIYGYKPGTLGHSILNSTVRNRAIGI